jgi:hypothetical protein
MSCALLRNTRPAASARRARKLAGLAVALGISIACADSTPPVAPPAPAAPAAAPAFPALSRAGEIYVAGASLYGAMSAYHGGVLASRFVLYGDDRFALQFSSPAWGFFEYGGRYARTDSGLVFAFDGSSIAGPWQATGTLSGERLSVTYNDLMIHSDFVDGVYVRAPATP